MAQKVYRERVLEGIDRLEKAGKLRRLAEYEAWMAHICSTEGPRETTKKWLFIGQSLEDCARQAQEQEKAVSNHFLANDLAYDDGGLPLVFKLEYLGIFELSFLDIIKNIEAQ